MSKQPLNKLPKPKFKPGQYITDGDKQSFKVDFVEYDFKREEYYYYPQPDTYAGKIYENKAKVTAPPKSSAMETYDMLFGKV